MNQASSRSALTVGPLASSHETYVSKIIRGSTRPLVPHADLKRTQRRWLGQGNQRGVRFSTAHLQSTLREISELRLGQPGALHRNFVAFGLYLASLHELLESLDCTLDVRSAFMRSYRRA